MKSETVLYPELDTPCVVVDLDVVRHNLQEMASFTEQHGVRLRPHVKTHKTAYFAALQMKLGACGVTVAKLGEAEVMADAGVEDILIAYPIWGEAKLRRLKALAERVRVIISLDSVEVAAGIASVGQELGHVIPLYLEIDTGMHRCGCLPGADAARLARRIHSLDGVELIGILTYPGHIYQGEPTVDRIRSLVADEVAKMRATLLALRGMGIPVREVSVGSSVTARVEATMDGVTEIRPGEYIFNDRNLLLAGLASEDTCALSVLTTVVSKPAADRAIIDAGSKALSSDRIVWPGQTSTGYGHVRGRPDLVIEGLAEEHGIVRVAEPVRGPAIGDRLLVIPNHACVVPNLFGEIMGVRNGRLEQVIPVEAQSKLW